MNKLKIEIEFFSSDKGGRDLPPNLSEGQYRPHLLVNGRPNDEYLGVQFIAQEGEMIFNKLTKAAIELVYKDVDYSSLKRGVEFSVMEGGKKVGIGKVL